MNAYEQHVCRGPINSSNTNGDSSLRRVLVWVLIILAHVDVCSGATTAPPTIQARRERRWVPRSEKALFHLFDDAVDVVITSRIKSIGKKNCIRVSNEAAAAIAEAGKAHWKRKMWFLIKTTDFRSWLSRACWEVWGYGTLTFARYEANCVRNQPLDIGSSSNNNNDEA
jgi:hypothetical protein